MHQRQADRRPELQRSSPRFQCSPPERLVNYQKMQLSSIMIQQQLPHIINRFRFKNDGKRINPYEIKNNNNSLLFANVKNMQLLAPVPPPLIHLYVPWIPGTCKRSTNGRPRHTAWPRRPKAIKSSSTIRFDFASKSQKQIPRMVFLYVRLLFRRMFFVFYVFCFRALRAKIQGLSAAFSQN